MKFAGLIILVLLLQSFDAKAQLDTKSDLISVFSSGDKIVKRALDSTICIVKQEYSLFGKNNKEYGWQGRSYFGSSYRVGVITSSGIKTDRRITMPWADDKNYDQFKKADTLKPRLTKTYTRRLAEKGFSEYADAHIDTAGKSGFVNYASNSPVDINTIKTVDSAGWVDVVSIRKNHGLSDTVQFVTSVYRASIAYKDTSNVPYIKLNNTKDNIIGGVYYSCIVTRGRIEFQAAGIIKKNAEGWYVDLFTTNGFEPNNNDGAKLTPARKDAPQLNAPKRNNNKS